MRGSCWNLDRAGKQPRHFLVVVLTVALALVADQSACGDVRFYASFDKTFDAEVAGGSPSGLLLRRGAKLVADGKWGRAVRGHAKSQLAYDVLGNLDLDQGTIEFFAKMDPFGDGQWAYNFINLSGAHGMKLGVSRQGRSKSFVLGWTVGTRTGWIPNAQRFVHHGTWQHYAITWDLTAGPGKGVVSVFVDGARRVHADDVDPLAWSPDQIFLGSSYTGASIDDLAIHDEVRFVENFAPRKKTLLQVALQKQPPKNKASSSPQKPFGRPGLVTGDFEDWQDGRPVGWNLVGNTVLVKDDRYRFSGRSSMLIKSGKYIEKYPYRGTSSDPLALTPNRSYRLRAWVSTPQSPVGDLRFDIVSSDGTLVGSYSSGWSTSHGWLPVDLSFRTNDCRQYTVSIYLRRHKNEFYGLMWIDNLRLEMNGESDQVVSEAEKARGFYLFSRSVMETSRFEKRMPSQGERIDRLSVSMGRGEYEPAFLGLYALRGLGDVDVRLVGDLEGPSGLQLDASAVTVRRVQESLLPLTRPRGVDRGGMLAWWATIKTSRDTAPGKYTGSLQVTVAGKSVARIPLRVHVMDVRLPDPRAAFLVYHHETYVPDQFLTPELRRAYYRDMVEHGMNTVTVYNNADVDGKQLDFAHNTGYAAGNPRRDYGLDTTMKMILDSGLCRTGQPVLWLTSRSGEKGYGWGGTPEPALKAMLGEWKKRKWPEPLFYATDEPGGTGPRAEAARSLLRTIKSWGLPIRTTTAGLEPEVLGKYFDVWIQGEAGVSQNSVRLAKKLKSEVWTYTCHGMHQNMPFPRALYGFWAARTGIKGVASWAYYDNKVWTADANGNVSGDPRTRLSQVCLSPNGPIPTIAWEAIREGVDDYRYLQFLQDLMARAETVVEKLSARSEALLTEDDRQMIDRREEQGKRRTAEIRPQPKLVRWEAKTDAEKRGERAWLAVRRIRSVLSLVQRSTESMLTAIPFDAMATRIGLAHGGHWSTYAPPMGPMIEGANMRTIADDHRRLVASHILYLQDTLNRTRPRDGR
ncbi:MAG: LamG-like jellyroll fold domain-containing protein [Planctomycetota bacterium]|nr:LamG-like jellyroll fold domain-containing protein [Planctomycetota bacterium]